MSAIAPNPSIRWRRRKTDRPAEILSAALASFTEHGFAATRLDDVAARAGVTKGTLYLYFDGKEELVSITSLPWYSRQVTLPEGMPASVELAEKQ